MTFQRITPLIHVEKPINVKEVIQLILDEQSSQGINDDMRQWDGGVVVTAAIINASSVLQKST